jgi:hypothetical protein
LLILVRQVLEDRRESRLLARKLLIEIARIRRITNRGEVRRWDALVVDVVKVDVFEEEVALDIFGIGFAGTESADRVAREQLYYQDVSCGRD